MIKLLPLINELQINKFYKYNEQDDWDLESLKKACNNNDTSFNIVISSIKTLDLPKDKPFKIEYIENKLLELGHDPNRVNTLVDFLIKYKIIK